MISLYLHYYVIDTQPTDLMHKIKASTIYKVSFTFYLLQKRNQKWRSLEKRSDETVKYIDIKDEIEKMPHFQEKQG